MDVTGDEPPVGVRGETFNAGRDRVREQPVVGVEEYDVISRALAEPGVAGCGRPLVQLMDVTRGWVVLDNRPRVVRRSVVHDDHFDRGIRLARSALDRLPDELRLVEEGNDD